MICSLKRFHDRDSNLGLQCAKSMDLTISPPNHWSLISLFDFPMHQSNQVCHKLSAHTKYFLTCLFLYVFIIMMHIYASNWPNADPVWFNWKCSRFNFFVLLKMLTYFYPCISDINSHISFFVYRTEWLAVSWWGIIVLPFWKLLMVVRFGRSPRRYNLKI